MLLHSMKMTVMESNKNSMKKREMIVEISGNNVKKSRRRLDSFASS